MTVDVSPAPEAADQDGDWPLLPPAVSRWATRCAAGWTRSDTWATAVVLAGVLLTLAVAWGGGLYADDIRGLALFSPEPLSRVLFWSGGSHVVPGTHLVLWLHGRVAGLGYWPVLVVVPLLRLAAGFSVWRLLRALFGPRPVSVVLLGGYVFLALSVSATAWYVQALTVLPVHLATAWALLALVRFHRTRRTRDALAVGGALLFGLAFAEKTLALVVFLPLFSVLVLAPPGGPRAALRFLVRQLRVWLVVAEVTVLWAVLYLGADGDRGNPASLRDGLELAGRALWSGVLPTLAGGPWAWRQGGILYEAAPYYGVAAAPVAASVLGAALAIGVLGLGLRSREGRPLSALLLVATWFAASTALVARARLTEIGTQLAIDLRFWADLAPVLAVAAGVAVVGHRVRTAPETRTARHGSDVALRIASPRWRALVAAGLCLWLASTLVSTASFAGDWRRNPSRAYLDALSAHLSTARTPVAVYDTEVPANVLNPIFRPWTNVSFVAGPVASKAVFGLNADPMYLVDEHGSLVPASWQEHAAGGRGPIAQCGWRLSAQDGVIAEIPFASPVTHQRDLSLRLDVLAGRGAHLFVAVSDGHRWRLLRRPHGVERSPAFDVPPGLNAVVMKLPPHPVAAVRVQGRPSDGVACLLATSVGVPVPRSP